MPWELSGLTAKRFICENLFQHKTNKFVMTLKCHYSNLHIQWLWETATLFNLLILFALAAFARGVEENDSAKNILGSHFKLIQFILFLYCTVLHSFATDIDTYDTYQGLESPRNLKLHLNKINMIIVFAFLIFRDWQCFSHVGRGTEICLGVYPWRVTALGKQTRWRIIQNRLEFL